MIKNISVELLYSHPQNPRKNIGDISELTESLKKNGLYQNLTVIEGGPGVPKGKEGYTVVIGHRRMNAAKAAGLKELPCLVAKMSEKEQVATMLLENMQRTDLTIYEQAQGFQLMLDLGETKETISEKTGFSAATVNKRLKLLNIHSDEFKNSQSKNITIEEYLRVADLKDEKDQEAALRNAGTNNFEWTIQRLLENQARREILEKINPELKQLNAKKISSWSDTYNGKYKKIKSFPLKEFKEGSITNAIPKNVTKVFYYLDNYDVGIYKESDKKKQEAPKKSKAELEAETLRIELREKTKQAYELRENFVLNFNASNKYAAVILKGITEIFANGICGYCSNNYDVIKKALKQDEGYYPNKEQLVEYMEKNPGNTPMLLTYSHCADRETTGYCNLGYGSTMPTYYKNKHLDLVYKLLCSLGYAMSDEEKQLQDGTHPLFKDAEAKIDGEE